MATVVRILIASAVLAVIGSAGCDGAGGLLQVTSNQPDGGGGMPTVVKQGPSVNELVSAGTVVKSAKYKAVYTMGQATPNQGVGKSATHRDNGGLVGAMNGVPASTDVP
jgi:hypothetical protein